METIDNLTSSKLTLETKSEDKVKCNFCNEGIMVPFNQQSKINHVFTCDKCGTTITLDCLVTVE